MDLGVRLAVGADAWHVVRMVLSDGARFVIGGLALGMAAALAVFEVFGRATVRHRSA